ncbi:hypothetical protein GYB22_11270 [bacterium]|nr:hypothetical protein [bacterium]
MAQVLIRKNDSDHILYVHRPDGSTEIARLGPALPFHDIAHFVVEKHFQIKQGFFGQIMNGMTVDQLSNSNVIRSLPDDSMISEVLTRALQGLESGSCRVEDFKEMVEMELSMYELHIPIDERDASTILSNYTALLKKWETMETGESLALEL